MATTKTYILELVYKEGHRDNRPCEPALMSWRLHDYYPIEGSKDMKVGYRTQERREAKEIYRKLRTWFPDCKPTITEIVETRNIRTISPRKLLSRK